VGIFDIVKGVVSAPFKAAGNVAKGLGSIVTGKVGKGLGQIGGGALGLAPLALGLGLIPGLGGAGSGVLSKLGGLLGLGGGGGSPQGLSSGAFGRLGSFGGGAAASGGGGGGVLGKLGGLLGGLVPKTEGGGVDVMKLLGLVGGVSSLIGAGKDRGDVARFNESQLATQTAGLRKAEDLLAERAPLRKSAFARLGESIKGPGTSDIFGGHLKRRDEGQKPGFIGKGR